MARDKQMQESKELITQALIRLLNQKPISAVNITEIADEAGVARMTLYRYFKSKEEIVLYIIEDKMEEYINQMDNFAELTLYDLFLFRFEFLKASPFTSMAHECNLLSQLLPIIRMRLIDRLQFLSRMGDDMFLQNFFNGGMDRVTEVWIEEGMTVPPNEMANKAYGLVKNLKMMFLWGS